MKKYNSPKIIPFCPNAKDKRYYIDKFVDGALTVATAMGAVVIMLFVVMV